MGLMDFVRGQLIDIIEWSDDSHDTLSYRFPDQDREIKRGAQLIVRESQAAQFVYLGQFGDTFGPGRHTLTTDNIPVLSRLRGWKYGFESPFKADVYFVTTRLMTGNPWGTSNAVMLHDADFGIVRVRAFGTYDFRVVDVGRFLRDVAGTDSEFHVDEFAAAMRSRIVSAFSEALAVANVPVLALAARYRELGDALRPVVNAVLKPLYGLEIAAFVVENVSVPPDVEQAIEKRASLQAIGDLKEFVNYQIGQSLARPGAAAGGFGAELAVGLVTAQQLLKDAGVATTVAAGALPDVLSPADVARALAVSEEEVVASLESGNLKGIRVGSKWRVTRAALADFLR